LPGTRSESQQGIVSQQKGIAGSAGDAI
jgi:hypothetical protein